MVTPLARAKDPLLQLLHEYGLDPSTPTLSHALAGVTYTTHPLGPLSRDILPMRQLALGPFCAPLHLGLFPFCYFLGPTKCTILTHVAMGF